MIVWIRIDKKEERKGKREEIRTGGTEMWTIG